MKPPDAGCGTGVETRRKSSATGAPRGRRTSRNWRFIPMVVPPVSGSDRGESAVDDEFAARDEAGRRRAQVDDTATDFIRSTQATDGVRRNHTGFRDFA